MKHKIYAVRIGRIPGIYDKWEHCKAQIDGYPSAQYKSFDVSQQKEAEVYIKKTPSHIPYIPPVKSVSANVPAWQPVAQCPPPPFTRCNVVFENEAGEMQLYPVVCARQPDMTWYEVHTGSQFDKATSNRFRYFMLIPDWPVV